MEIGAGKEMLDKSCSSSSSSSGSGSGILLSSSSIAELGRLYIELDKPVSIGAFFGCFSEYLLKGCAIVPPF